MWQNLKTLTSYQDLDGGNVLPLLNEDNQSVFDMQGKCDRLQDTFFSGKHLENNNFDKNFKLDVENELKELRSENNPEELFDSVAIYRKISLEETEASLEYLKL